MTSATGLPRNLRPATIPVMVLGGVGLFPSTCMTLHIFEPRYRAMLACALESDRLVAIAAPRDPAGERVLEVGCAGMVRACVRNADGTSNLILQGLCRVRFTGWTQMEPFRLGTYAVFGEDSEESFEELETRLTLLRRRLRELVTQLPDELDGRIDRISHPDVLVDVAAAGLLGDARHRQAVLAEPEGARRQDLLLRLLGVLM